MAKRIVKASIISATVGAAVGAAAIAVSNKKTRDKAAKAVSTLKTNSTKAVNDLYKSARKESKKLTEITKKSPVKKVTVKKAVKKGGK